MNMRQQLNLTHAIEDYLKAIYLIETAEGRASTKQIADRLEITAASVTGMLKKLAETDPPLIMYQKHRGVVLTEPGRRIALEIVRHHRLLELFLHQKLGFEWEDVHAEADRLEHVISEQFEERIAEALGHPSHDPHGDPIPTRELVLPDTANLRICDLNVGDEAEVRRVANTDNDLLRYLSDVGLVPGARLRVAAVSPFDDIFHLDVDEKKQPLVLGLRIAQQVFVERIGG